MSQPIQKPFDLNNPELWVEWLKVRLANFNAWLNGDDENNFESPFEMAATIFDVTTYQSDMDEYFVLMILDVAESLINGTTFDYHGENDDNLKSFLTVLNLSFFVDKIEWGTSIRGAWFNLNKPFTVDGGVSDDENYNPIIETTEHLVAMIKGIRLFVTDNVEEVQTQEG